MSDPAVLAQVAGGVARVTINRPDQGNTLMADVLDGLDAALDAVERDDNVVAVTITGAGERHFSSGLNASLVTGANRDQAPVVLERTWRLAKRVADLRPVTVAAVNGVAFAGGFALAMACDLRIASENAAFKYPGTEYGLAVGTFQLPYLIGETWAKEVLLLAKMVTAAEAYRMGMVNEVVPLADLPAATDAVVRRLLELSPQGLRNTKLLINRALRSHPDEAFEREIEWLARFAAGDHVQKNFDQAIAARLARRAQQRQAPNSSDGPRRRRARGAVSVPPGDGAVLGRGRAECLVRPRPLLILIFSLACRPLSPGRCRAPEARRCAMPEEALLVVDLQNDFCVGGPLGVPASPHIIDAVNEYLRAFERRGACLIASRDWHPPVTRHFQEHGGPWPVHCVQGTPGAEFHPDLRLPPETVIVSKGQDPDEDSYSAFQARLDDGRRLVGFLRENGVRRLYVGG
ncbi:MAG TPA: isochorismatase family protein, partial [Dehalococcoidia bacterium]|nr:isochorismatase family protein [Dehalococcoidia bacterium]